MIKVASFAISAVLFVLWLPLTFDVLYCAFDPDDGQCTFCTFPGSMHMVPHLFCFLTCSLCIAGIWEKHTARVFAT